MILDSLLYEIGIDTKGLQQGLDSIKAGAQQVDNEFNGMASRWSGVVQGLISNVIAPVAGAFAVGKVINSYMSDVAEVATLTGAYNQKLDEWRIKRAQLARVTKEDIQLYKQYKEAMTGFNIAIADVSAKLVRSFSPVMKLAVRGLQEFTKWINRNQDNIVRFLLVVSGVLTGVFMPALLKTGAALLMSPLTWLIGALGVLVVIVDDLTTYLRGGQSALSGFWSYFGTGPEIMAKLTKAFETFKAVLSVVWKPLALLAAGFASFKIGAVLVKGFVSALTGLKAIMTTLAAHPFMAALFALISIILWVSDAFKRAGGDWSKVMDIMAQDLIDFLNLFGGLGDYLSEALSGFKEFFSAVGALITGVVSTVYNTFKLIWAYLSGAPDEVKAALVDSLSNALTSVAQALNDFIAGILSGLYSLLQSAANGLMALGPMIVDGISAALSGVVTLLGRLGSLILALLTAAIKAIGNILANMATSVVNAISGVFSALFGVIASVLASIGNAIAQTFNAALAIITDLGSSIINAFVDVGKSVQGVFIAIVQAIEQVINAIVGSVTSVANSIGQAFDSAWQWIKQGGVKLVESVKALFLGAFSTISGIVASVVDTVTSLFSFISNVAANAVASITNLFSSISAIATQIWESINGVFNALASALSEVWGNVTRAIKNAVAGAVNNIISVFGKVKGFFSSLASNILQAFTKAVGSLVEVFEQGKELITAGFAKVKGVISSIADSMQGLGSTVSSIFDAVVNTITGAFDAGLNAAIEFFNSIFDFFAQIPARLAKAFDISGLISGATDKLKNMAGDAVGSVKSFFGFGNTEKEQAQNIEATKQAVVNTMQSINTGLVNSNQALANTPTVANTSSVTNSTYNTDNSRRSNNQQNVNNTININVPSGSDARGIVREAQKSFHNFNASNNYVMASEYGNYNS